MAVLNLRTVAAVAVGIGLGAALARRREAAVEPCRERPTVGVSCC